MLKPKNYQNYNSTYDINYEILKKLYELTDSGITTININDTPTQCNCTHVTFDDTSILTALDDIKNSIDNKTCQCQTVETIKEVVVEKPVYVEKEVVVEKVIYKCPPPEQYITVETIDETDYCEPVKKYKILNPEYKAYMEEQRKKKEKMIKEGQSLIKHTCRGINSGTRLNQTMKLKHKTLHKNLYKRIPS